MKRLFICVLILMTISTLSFANLTITVEPNTDWGNAPTSNIKKLCENVALHFQENLRDEHKIDGGLTIVYWADGPVTFYRTFFGGDPDEYKIGLTVNGTFWDQMSYQFGHEFCHLMHNHDAMKNSRNYWFNEAICELAAVWVLFEMGETWEDRAPYPNWTGYRQNLTNYAQNLIDITQYTGTGAQWLETWEDAMRSKEPDAFNYPRVSQLSYKFLDIFQDNPEAWNAVRQMPASSSEMDTYMKEWYQDVDTQDKEFVESMAEIMGISVLDEMPTDILTDNSNITYLAFIGGDQPTPNEFGLNPQNAANEWNYWRNVIDNRTNNNRDITIDGTKYDRGISVVPGNFQDSIIIYDLTGADYIMFQGYVGLSDEHDHIIRPNLAGSCHQGGSAIFVFEIDGIEMFNSGIVDGSDAPMLVEFEILTDAKELKIIINNAGDGRDCDAASIGDPKLIHSGMLTQTSISDNDTIEIDADVNNDGYVDLYDVLIVRSGMNAETSYDTDLNDDGKTDEVDLLIVKALAIEAITAASPSKRKINITTWGAMKTR